MIYQFQESPEKAPDLHLKISNNLFTYESLAEYLGVHKSTLRKWKMQGKLSCIKLAGGNSVRFTSAQVQEFLEKNSVEGSI